MSKVVFQGVLKKEREFSKQKIHNIELLIGSDNNVFRVIFTVHTATQPAQQNTQHLEHR